jgi:hypothetical protein
VPRVISFPFALDGTGAVATVDQDSDVEVEQQLAVAVLTRPGERIVVPTFGVDDPAFVHFLTGALQRHCLDFGPDVTIIEVNRALRSDDREIVSINWSRDDETREAPQ